MSLILIQMTMLRSHILRNTDNSKRAVRVDMDAVPDLPLCLFLLLQLCFPGFFFCLFFIISLLIEVLPTDCLGDTMSCTQCDVHWEKYGIKNSKGEKLYGTSSPSASRLAVSAWGYSLTLAIYYNSTTIRDEQRWAVVDHRIEPPTTPPRLKVVATSQRQNSN